MAALSEIGNFFSPLWTWLFALLDPRPRFLLIIITLVLTAAAFFSCAFGNSEIEKAYGSTLFAWALRWVGGYLLLYYVGKCFFSMSVSVRIMVFCC